MSINPYKFDTLAALAFFLQKASDLGAPVHWTFRHNAAFAHLARTGAFRQELQRRATQNLPIPWAFATTDEMTAQAQFIAAQKQVYHIPPVIHQCWRNALVNRRLVYEAKVRDPASDPVSNECHRAFIEWMEAFDAIVARCFTARTPANG
ncbi:hypothetical protein CC80DRAFT_509933 [Byssothecium circinans]|uniref:Uncharacterized protein n=1 Tax=Byssothecium circinans TaxID=147558 RepID=A0A6A5TBM5_9PLEO|nr:hypothetical protein CC80DRAFT_509933 [Byssothecium circinans]